MKTIGKYVIRGLLGKGGMGRVYKVEIPVIGKICALKRLEPDPILTRMMGREKLAALFQAEAMTMAGIRHPSIVEILDYDDASDGLYYVMDYHWNNLGIMIGESYRTERPSRVVSVEKAIHYSQGILNGLARLHHAGIIHRDIKPYNILVTDQDTVKIGDFGLSKLRGEPFAGPSNLNVGSPFYAAPEQERDPNSVDESADLFAVGVMLYRMLTGVLPETDLSGKSPPYGASRHNSDLNDKWDDFLFTAMALRPGDRFRTAADMLTALTSLETQWEERKANVCALAPDKVYGTATGQPASARHPVHLRHTPVKVDRRRARERFAVDALWRPEHYIENAFVTMPDGTVRDRTTGLIWQRSGSPYPLTFPEAVNAIEALNRIQFAGRTDWRMPTMDELMSLLIPVPQGADICMESVFDPRQKWIWSADRRSFTSAWYASMDLGFVHWQDFTARFYVKGVCSV